MALRGLGLMGLDLGLVRLIDEGLRDLRDKRDMRDLMVLRDIDLGDVDLRCWLSMSNRGRWDGQPTLTLLYSTTDTLGIGRGLSLRDLVGRDLLVATTGGTTIGLRLREGGLRLNNGIDRRGLAVQHSLVGGKTQRIGERSELRHIIDVKSLRHVDDKMFQRYHNLRQKIKSQKEIV